MSGIMQDRLDHHIFMALAKPTGKSHYTFAYHSESRDK